MFIKSYMNINAAPEKGTTQAPSETHFNSGAGFEARPNATVELGGTTLFTADTAGNVVSRSRLDDIDPSIWTSVQQPEAQIS